MHTAAPIARSRVHIGRDRRPEIFAALIAPDGPGGEGRHWDPTEYATLASGSGNEALVASRLLTDLELRRLLTGDQGQDWLTDSTLRHAGVNFLLNQQRFSKLDTADVRVRYATDGGLTYGQASPTSASRASSMCWGDVEGNPRASEFGHDLSRP